MILRPGQLIKTFPQTFQSLHAYYTKYLNELRNETSEVKSKIASEDQPVQFTSLVFQVSVLQIANQIVPFSLESKFLMHPHNKRIAQSNSFANVVLSTKKQALSKSSKSRPYPAL
jgi:hypothetical protein